MNVGSTELPAFNEDTLRIPRRQERVSGKRRGFGIDGGQDLTSHDRGPMSPKPSSPSEEPDSRILRGYYGAKEFDNPGPLCTGPKAHAEKGEIAEDGQRKPKWPKNVAEDNPALSILNPKRREQHTSKGGLPECPQEKDNYSRIPIGVWCRSNPRRNYHLHIECAQLMFWRIYEEMTPE